MTAMSQVEEMLAAFSPPLDSDSRCRVQLGICAQVLQMVAPRLEEEGFPVLARLARDTAAEASAISHDRKAA